MMKLAGQRMTLLPLLFCASLVEAHFVITYPGWRGNTLGLNETFPNGMQSEAPCGGLPVTHNRTAWPVDGPGAFAIQPGWYANNEHTEFFISIGLGPDPDDFSQQINSFRGMGPTDNPFPDSFCLPQVNIPEEVRGAHGNFASIQFRQVHVSGNSAQNCADIYFTDDLCEVAEIDPACHHPPLPQSTTETSAAPTAGGSDELTGAGSRFVSNILGMLGLVLFF
ncbi:hypothetical protein S40288_11251 [Stachybotrys chartarum IBT 40288]|nr:hypothetical protein S40288_11251 [Stachybotrys chartarum IBT 40288]